MKSVYLCSPTQRIGESVLGVPYRFRVRRVDARLGLVKFEDRTMYETIVANPVADTSHGGLFSAEVEGQTVPEMLPHGEDLARIHFQLESYTVDFKELEREIRGARVGYNPFRLRGQREYYGKVEGISRQVSDEIEAYRDSPKYSSLKESVETCARLAGERRETVVSHENITLFLMTVVGVILGGLAVVLATTHFG